MKAKQYVCEEDFATEYEDVYREAFSTEVFETPQKGYIVYFEGAGCNECVERIVLDERNKSVILHYAKDEPATRIIWLALKYGIEMSWEHDHYTLNVDATKVHCIKSQK